MVREAEKALLRQDTPRQRERARRGEAEERERGVAGGARGGAGLRLLRPLQLLPDVGAAELHAEDALELAEDLRVRDRLA